MASPVNAVLCALVATALWTWLGYALGRRLFDRGLAVAAAPVVGWAVHSAVALPIFILIGFSPVTVVVFAALCAVVAGVTLFGHCAGAADSERAAMVPWWAYSAAAALALVPAVAILPKISANGVHLADPIFDHSKIAIIDAMTRQGLPPINPVFGELGSSSHIVYYYLWHFSAAELALPLHRSGWEADIGLTWFTAFASLSLMMGLAVWLSQRPLSAYWVVLLAAATSLRTTVDWIFGRNSLSFLMPSTGFAGWLFQSAWVPQHLMSASCVVTAMLLIARYVQRQSPLLLVALVLICAAGFESSTYVGGVTFALAVALAAPILFFATDANKRVRVASGLAVGAVLVGCLAVPFIFDQFSTVAARGDAAPIVLHHFEVLGETLPVALRRALDVPAFWFILLPIEFPAVYIAGVVALTVMLQATTPTRHKLTVAIFGCLAAAGLLASWLLVSTLGDNNDLGLRAILPAVLVLIVVTAAGMMLLPRRAVIVVMALGGLVLSLPQTVAMIHSNVAGTPANDAAVFAQAPELWNAVRRYASSSDRVANDPLFLQDLTPWPVNISWALLANRSSCFAGRELALAFAPLSSSRREAINAQFIRVFNDQGSPADIDQMAKQYRCDVVVVVPQDKIWADDPFAASPDYRLAEDREGKWRIYVRRN